MFWAKDEERVNCKILALTWLCHETAETTLLTRKLGRQFGCAFIWGRRSRDGFKQITFGPHWRVT
uniref:Uncharacterized protein n=1 Tax=Arundo donax TaxID=35708 RepID=A0A0A8Z5U1_ARUDO